MGKTKTVNKTKSITNKPNVAVGTIAPIGMTVTRSGNTFTVSWKCGDEDYASGQWVMYSVNNGAQSGAIEIHSALSSYSLTLANARTITFWVCGKRKPYTTSVTGDPTKSTKTKKKNGTKTKTVTTTTVTTVTTYYPDVSGWSAITWTATVPALPSLNYSKITSSSGSFSWNLSVDNSGTGIFKDIELQTCTSRNKSNPPGSGWSSSAVGNSGTVTYTETISAGNVIRWVRVRSRGPGGNSAWVYAHHAYGNPAAPVLLSASAALSGTVTRVTVTWKAPFSILDPIDTITVQYVIATPTTTNLSAPASGWSDDIRVAGNGGNDKVITNISDQVGTDECMWIRLKATHDDFEVYSSKAICVYKGALATPGINATPNVSSGNVAITITENTGCDVAGTVIFYRSEKRPNYDQIVAVLSHGTTSTSVHIDEIMSSYPNPVETTCFGAYAFVGTHSGLSVSAQMKSGIATDSDILARPPAWLSLDEGTRDDNVRIGWPWTWTAATNAELSWADHDDAWESTDEPEVYPIDDRQVSSWLIAKLQIGRKWYFRVRLIYEDDDEKIIGPWSETYDFDLSTIPNKPVLILNKNVVSQAGILTARWVYSSDDETEQSYADIYMYESTGTQPSDIEDECELIAHVGENQTVEIDNEWHGGKIYFFYLRLTSTAGRQSEWSDPVRVYAADPIDLVVSDNSLVETDGISYLKELPLSVTVTGAGIAGQTIVSIIRAEDYHIFRPDGSDEDGFAGETIATIVMDGEGEAVIAPDDLVGYLDDGAKYILRCTAVDEYEQTASVEIPFTVSWTHQAGKPSAVVKMDEYQRIAIITPIAPANYEEGDVCDIYRISADKPELIVQGAEFGESYVDPYPAFGDFCGHRIVTRTRNDDYITEDNHLAWFHADQDIGDILIEKAMIIDVAGEQIELPYNIEIQNSWTKDFKRTAYLGGSVQGDWNPAVTRDISANTVLLRGRDIDTQLSMRNLAGYAGIAHIRTPDGSSVTADIQVRESMSYQNKRVSYSLAIKVVDPEGLDGMTYEEWQGMNPAE